MTKQKPQVFKSMAEFRAHFFPDKFHREQQRAKIETNLDESKYNQPGHRRQLTKEQVEDLEREIGLR